MMKMNQIGCDLKVIFNVYQKKNLSIKLKIVSLLKWGELGPVYGKQWRLGQQWVKPRNEYYVYY
jgi:hypothetical protein